MTGASHRRAPRRPPRPRAAGALALALMAATLVASSSAGAARPAGGAPRPAAAAAHAQALADSGRFGAAESLATAVLAAAFGAPSPSDSAAALDVVIGARFELMRSTVPGTQALAERAVALREAQRPCDTLRLAAALDRLANVRFAGGDNAGARSYFERALALRAAALPEDDPLRARGVHQLARVAYAMSDFAGARDGFARALAMRERALGPQHPDVAMSLSGLSASLSVLGDLRGARAAAERALAIREHALPPDHPDVIQSLGSVARLRAEQGDLTGARALGERAVASADRAYGPLSTLAAQPRIELGNVLSRLGEDAGARACFERALAINERAYPPNHRVVIQSLNWLAWTLITQGDVDAAEPLIDRALAGLDPAADANSVTRASLLNARARLLVRRGRPAAAESVTVEELRIDEHRFGPDHANVAQDCSSIGAYRCQQGDYAGGRPWFERAVGIYERTQRPDSLHLALALDGLGTTQMTGGDTAAAARTFARTLAIRERWLGPDHPDLVPTLIHLATLAIASGRPAEGGTLAERAEANSRQQLRMTAETSSEREALALAAGRVSALDLVVDAAARPGVPAALRANAWDAMLRSRAVVLDATAQHAHTAHEGDSLTAARRTAVQDARSNLAALVVRGPGRDSPAQYQEGLDRWRHEVDLAERALLESSPHLVLQRTREASGFDAIAAALPAGSALVAFARYRPAELAHELGPARYAAFVLRGGARAPSVVPLGEAAGIEAALERWDAALGRRPPVERTAAQTAERTARGLGATVRRRVWDPLAPALGDAGRVFVVPDGALALAPLAALPLADGRYLAERGPLLHVLTSERDLVDEPARARTGAGLLALGGAAFDSAAAAPAPLVAYAAPPFRGLRARCAEFSRVRFAPLPGTAREVEDVAALWQAAAGTEEVRVLSGVEADEAGFARLAPGRRVLHLATHGFFVDPRCATGGGGGRGVGELADAAPTAAPEAAPPTESPLRLSGLALAGANRRESVPLGGEDGVLTAEEVAALDLDGVEWAVLSGCDTGVGRLLAGEGVLGLRRAFQVAGVRTVIMSLWPVEDAATRDWMVALYHHRLAERLGTAESVRAAARDLIAARRARGLDTHPFRWAAFIAAGDWR